MLATLGPLAEELIVFPSTVLEEEKGAEQFALAFAINCNAPGLKFICRDTLDPGRSHFDAPLASRFEEMDCVVIFDNVLIPWERMFLSGDIARCNVVYAETNAVVNMMHQVVVKNAVKAEFLLGLAARIAEVSDAMTLPHVRDRLAEMIITAELMRSCLRAAEADAHQDKWGEFIPARAPLDVARNLLSAPVPAHGGDHPAHLVIQPGGDACRRPISPVRWRRRSSDISDRRRIGARSRRAVPAGVGCRG